MEYGSAAYVQKSAKCIDSKVAPVLSNILLSRVEGMIAKKLHGLGEIFRYVYDFLVFYKGCDSVGPVHIVNLFKEQGLCLKFTLEKMSQQKELRFLNLTLMFCTRHVC